MENLPHLCILIIARSLSPMELRNFMRVSKSIYTKLCICLSTFKVADFSLCAERMVLIPSSGSWIYLKNVSHLGLRHCLCIKNFSILNELEKLAFLDVYGTNITDNELCFINHNLKGINIGYCPQLTNDGIAAFAKKQHNLISVGLAGIKNIITAEVSNCQFHLRKDVRV